MSKPKSDTLAIIALMEGLAKSKSEFESEHQHLQGRGNKYYKDRLAYFDSTLDILASYQYTVERRTKLRASIGSFAEKLHLHPLSVADAPAERQTEHPAVQAAMRKCEEKGSPDELTENFRSNQISKQIQAKTAEFGKAWFPVRRSKSLSDELIQELDAEINNAVIRANKVVKEFNEYNSLTERAQKTWNELHQIQQQLNEAMTSVNKNLMNGSDAGGQQVDSKNDNELQKNIRARLHSLETAPQDKSITDAQELIGKIKASRLLPTLRSKLNELVTPLPSLNDHLEVTESIRWLQQKAEESQLVSDAISRPASVKEKTAILTASNLSEGSSDSQASAEGISHKRTESSLSNSSNDSRASLLLSFSCDDNNVGAVEDSYKKHGIAVNAFFTDCFNQYHSDTPVVQGNEQLHSAAIRSFKELELRRKGSPTYTSVHKALRRVIKDLSASISKLSESSRKPRTPKNLKDLSMSLLRKEAERLFDKEAKKRATKTKVVDELRQTASNLQLNSACTEKLTFLAEKDSSFSNSEAQLQASIMDLKSKAEGISVDSEWSELRTLEAALVDTQKQIDNIDGEYQRVQKRIADESLRVQKRLEVNELINKNQTSWDGLLTRASKLNSGLDVSRRLQVRIQESGVTVAENTLKSLSVDVDASRAAIQRAEKESGIVRVTVVNEEKEGLQLLPTDASMAEIEKVEKVQLGLQAELGTLSNKLDEQSSAENVTAVKMERLRVVERLHSIRAVLTVLQNRKDFDFALKAFNEAVQEAQSDKDISQLYKDKITAKFGPMPFASLDSDSHLPRLKAKRLANEERRFLYNIVDDVPVSEFPKTEETEETEEAKSSRCNVVLTTLLNRAQKKQGKLFEDIDEITEGLKNHYDSNATGKRDIDTRVANYKRYGGYLTNLETNDNKSLFEKLIALRATNGQASKVIEDIGDVAHSRLSISGLQKILLTVVDFCRYCVRRLTNGIKGEASVGYFKGSSRHSIYTDIHQRAQNAVTRSFEGREAPRKSSTVDVENALEEKEVPRAGR